jgi:hypothetical protein
VRARAFANSGNGLRRGASNPRPPNAHAADSAAKTIFFIRLGRLVLLNGSTALYHRNADSESRQAIDTVTFTGMLVATIVGIAFPPAYFAVFGRKGR